ncbi:type II-A CRISPR-associated protein Csn2 [Lactobacillus melliventris]|uniref:Type II-A CRISPR-associated protein Csn2 n=1 Tax=Lactobacillus melliventris TaxID=1218507 RepID=A0ABX5MZS7_9LACO|nr:type II-A CRISPR-associated protein Csn2 [Lactobacillus melliventris]PXY83943.1 type II-A CRISPR-associated protein Csn2 [Lactobacillus melliventris]
MILTYTTHKKWVFKDPGIKIIGLQSPIAYCDIIQGFQGKNKMLLCSEDDYNPLDIGKTFDFIGDPLLSGDITKKYMPHIVNSYLTNLDEENRNKMIKSFYSLETILQDSLLLEDLPLAINFDEDLKKLLKLTEIHLDKSMLLSPYGIIETVLKIHQTCNLKTIPVICNVAHYLEERKWQELASLVTEMNLILVVIEFTTKENLAISKDIPFYYIDKDLIDWY